MSGVPAGVLATMAGPVSASMAQGIVRDHYGLAGSASPLTGERDSNFRVRAESGRDYLLKIANPAESPAIADFQTGALLHLAVRDPRLPVPEVVPSLSGQPYFQLNLEGQARTIRLLTFLQGEPLAGQARSPRLRHNLGAGLARLDLGLRDYGHPAAGQDLLWDLSRAPALRPLIVHIPDERRRNMIVRLLDRLEAEVLPRLAKLRRQVIHNDFNPSNILVGADEDGARVRLAGIIDFGDMVEAALVNEVAVAASYHVAETGPLLEPMIEFVSGYHALLPLHEEEIAILFDLIQARMMLTAIITSWRCVLDPGNRDYILRNAGRAWMGLERAGELSQGEALAQFHRALNRETGR